MHKSRKSQDNQYINNKKWRNKKPVAARHSIGSKDQLRFWNGLVFFVLIPIMVYCCFAQLLQHETRRKLLIGTEWNVNALHTLFVQKPNMNESNHNMHYREKEKWKEEEKNRKRERKKINSVGYEMVYPVMFVAVFLLMSEKSILCVCVYAG